MALPKRDFPQDWAATTQHNLGAAYSELPSGDRGDNLKRAIACYEAALRVRTERDFPQDWAATQNNLGNAYFYLPSGDRADNLKRAIACYEAALRVRTERDFPQDWATTQNNLEQRFLGASPRAIAATTSSGPWPATRRPCACVPSPTSRKTGP